MAPRKRTIRDVDPSGKKVFVRVDFNVPLESGKVADDTRIRAALPTIASLTERGGALALCSHLGRPKGRDPKTSLAPVAERLSVLLGRDVPLLGDCVGPAVTAAVAKLKAGSVVSASLSATLTPSRSTFTSIFRYLPSRFGFFE